MLLQAKVQNQSSDNGTMDIWTNMDYNNLGRTYNQMEKTYAPIMWE